MKLPLCITMFAMLLLNFSQQHSVRADEILKLRTQSGIAGWAVDQNSGQLFAAWPEKSSVLQYDLDGKLQRLRKVDGNPLWLAVKKKQLFVVSEGGQLSCFAIQPQSLKELSCRGIGSRVALPPIYSESDNPFLYFLAIEKVREVAGRSIPDSDVKIVKYDVNQKVKVAEQPFQTDNGTAIFGTRSAEPGSLSPDGKYLFASSGRGYLFDFDENTLTATRNNQFDGLRSNKQNFICNFDQGSRYLGLGSGLIRISDLAKMEFLGGVVQIHPRYDLAVSVSEKDNSGRFRLFFQRFSDRKLLKIIQLAGTPSDKSPRDTHRQSLLRFTINDKMWLAMDDDAWLINLDKLALPKQKNIDVEIPNLQVPKGGNLAFDLTKKRPAGSDVVSWELLDGPKGMTLDNSRLIWAPAQEQNGSFKVSMRMTADSRSIVKSFNVSVVSDNASIDIGGDIAEVKVNLAGDIALCRTDTRGRDRYVAVDLDSGKVLSSCEVDVPIRNVLLTKKYFYYIERERDWMLIRRPFSNLDTEESEDLLTQIRSLNYFSKDELALTTGEPAELFRIPADEPRIPNRDNFKRDVLVKTDNRLKSTSRFGAGSTRTSSHFSQISDQFLYVNGIVRDAASGTPTAIVDNLHLPIYVEKDAKPGYRYRDISPMPLPFGNITDYEERGTRSTKKSAIFQLSPFSARLSPNHLEPNVTRTKSLSPYVPVTFSCVVTDTLLAVTATSNVGNKRIASAELESGVFDRGTLRAVPIPFKDGLVVAFEDRIHLFKLSEDQKANLPQPLQIAYPTHTEITASTRETIQLQTVGGVGDIKFKNLNSGNGTLLNEETGEIVIDTAELVCGSDRLKMPNAANDPASVAPLNIYNDLFGTRHNPSSELGLYPVSVEARDSIGQRTTICFFVAISKLKASGFDEDKVAVTIPPPRAKDRKPNSTKRPTPKQKNVARNDIENNGNLSEQEKKIESLESTSKSIEQQLKGIEALLRQDARSRGK